MTINLTKDNSGRGDGSTLDGFDRIRIGVSWDTSTRGKSGLLGKASKKVGKDLDAFAVLMQGDKPVTLVIGADPDLMNPLHGREGDGSVVHSGDNTTGQGEGIDEQIDVQLSSIPLKYSSAIFGVAAFKNGVKEKLSGDKGFRGANNVEFTLFNTDNGGEEVASIMPSLLGTDNCCLVAKINRTKQDDKMAPWDIEILEEFVSVRPGDLDSLISSCLNR